MHATNVKVEQPSQQTTPDPVYSSVATTDIGGARRSKQSVKPAQAPVQGWVSEYGVHHARSTSCGSPVSQLGIQHTVALQLEKPETGGSRTVEGSMGERDWGGVVWLGEPNGDRRGGNGTFLSWLQGPEHQNMGRVSAVLKILRQKSFLFPQSRAEWFNEPTVCARQKNLPMPVSDWSREDGVGGFGGYFARRTFNLGVK